MTRPLGVICLVILLTAIAYWAGLSGPLVFDDAQNLLPISQWLQGECGWTSVVFGNESGRFGRPISMASFVLNVWLLGPEVWSLKLGNLVLHLFNGALVYLLFADLLRARALTREPSATSHWLPVLAAALWLLHPLLASTVLYVVQRMAMLSATFLLLAMLSYLRGRLDLQAGRVRRGWLLLLLAVPLCTVLAALSKENGVLAPALCAVIEMCVFFPAAGSRRPWPSRLVVLAGLVAPALIAIALVAMQHPVITGGYVDRPFTLAQRLLTQPRVLWDYIGSLVLPFGPRLGLYHDDYPTSQGLFQPVATLLAILAWLIVLAIGWWQRRRIPGLLLGTGIFLVGHALESSVFPLLMYFEHRNYLPAVGAIWALLAVAVHLAERLRPRMHHASRIFASASVAVVVVLAMATAGRAMVWRSQDTLLAQALEYHPDSRWLRLALIQQAMARTPPDAGTAREHAERLLSSSEPSTRRLGAVLELTVDCASGNDAKPSLVATAFAGRPEPMEADLLVAIESLTEGLIHTPCAGLAPADAATRLEGLLGRSTLPDTSRNIWRLRLKAAKLELAAGHRDAALAQARLALARGHAEAPVPLFVAALLLQRNDIAGASRMVDLAQTKIRADDVQGNHLIEQYRLEIRARRER